MTTVPRPPQSVSSSAQAAPGATPSVPNPAKDRLRAGGVVLGMNVRLVRSGDIALIAKTTGHDFLFIDVQHSLYTVETIGHIAQVALGVGITPMVRVRSCDDPQTSVLLDNGVTGIVFPDVGSAAEAQRAVDRCRFPPVGRRSVGGGYPMFEYRPTAVADAVPALDNAVLTVCMIETRDGLEHVEEIAAVDGVDVIHVGSNDLLAALGLPGAFGCPEHLAALDRVLAAAHAHGKVAGVGGDRNLARQVEFIRKGMRFVTTNSEIAFILAEGARVTGALREALGDKGAT
ncbi:MAG: aldolase [Proteobacteria bacterium]|nr:aldolase [Burkholderiales bacterium]